MLPKFNVRANHLGDLVNMQIGMQEVGGVAPALCVSELTCRLCGCSWKPSIAWNF